MQNYSAFCIAPVQSKSCTYMPAAVSCPFFTHHHYSQKSQVISEVVLCNSTIAKKTSRSEICPHFRLLILIYVISLAAAVLNFLTLQLHEATLTGSVSSAPSLVLAFRCENQQFVSYATGTVWGDSCAVSSSGLSLGVDGAAVTFVCYFNL